MATANYNYPAHAKFLHMGIAIFGIASFLTGEFAEDGPATAGYLIHAYLGLSLASFALVRIVPGLLGAGHFSFSGWSPLSHEQWRKAKDDVLCLLHWKVPERGMHEGLAGLTQFFGLVVFMWMGATGTGLFLLDGSWESPLFEVIEEIHEVGEALIPAYLFLHVGSVAVHSFAGSPIWNRMWSFRRKR